MFHDLPSRVVFGWCLVKTSGVPVTKVVTPWSAWERRKPYIQQCWCVKYQNLQAGRSTSGYTAISCAPLFYQFSVLHL